MSGSEKESMSYSSTGVDYSAIDPIKKLAQVKAQETSINLSRFNATEIVASRGESAYVWEEEDRYGAFVIEGLGTKNLIADATRKFTGRTHYDTIAQDTVAMIVNDLIVVGAAPQVVDAYWAIGDSKFLKDEDRMRDLVEGWANACNLAGATWGGGETPVLKEIINPETIDLAGSAIGYVKPKERLSLGEKLIPGDVIFSIESSGVHSNAITLTRDIAKQLPKGYETLLPDGKSYGESLLAPTHIYAKVVEDMLNNGVDVHYMVNITGHGWRKIMRAKKDLSYIVEHTPRPQAIFNFIQEQSGNDDREMYGNFNMGVGFAVFVPEKDVVKAIHSSFKNNMYGTRIGYVDQGPKKLVIKPKGLEYSGDELDIR